MIVSDRVVAAVGLGGTFCDAVGGLYLTYDLFGRHIGLLGFITRAVTYSIVLGLPFWIALGPAFGVITGVGFGILVSYDFWNLARIQRLQLQSPLYQSTQAGMARGIVMGLAAMPRFGVNFGLIFGALTSAALGLLYRFGFVRTTRVGFEGRHLWPPRTTVKAAFYRGACTALTAAAAIAFVGGHELGDFGFEVGALVGISSIAVAFITPHVEWWTEHAPDKFFVVTGLSLLAIGLVLDCIPHAAVLLGLRH